jgi:uncharacterized membrane protein
MNLDSWLHVVHVLAAMVWVGGGVILSLVGLRARSNSNPAAIGDFARTLRYVGLRALMPAVVLVLVTGVWQVLASSAWKLSQLWVVVALGLFGVAFLIGAVYLSRVGIALERVAEGDGSDKEDAVGLLNRWLVGYTVVLGVLLVAVWDMVFKPGV